MVYREWGIIQLLNGISDLNLKEDQGRGRQLEDAVDFVLHQKELLLKTVSKYKFRIHMPNKQYIYYIRFSVSV
jgi:hypothetical protein